MSDQTDLRKNALATLMRPGGVAAIERSPAVPSVAPSPAAPDPAAGGGPARPTPRGPGGVAPGSGADARYLGGSRYVRLTDGHLTTKTAFRLAVDVFAGLREAAFRGDARGSTMSEIVETLLRENNYVASPDSGGLRGGGR